jgi:hypothetical protein
MLPCEVASMAARPLSGRERNSRRDGWGCSRQDKNACERTRNKDQEQSPRRCLNFRELDKHSPRTTAGGEPENGSSKKRSLVALA